MAGKTKHDYPPKPQLEQLLDEAGSTVEAARRLGIAGPTLRHHLTKLDIELPRPAWRRALRPAPTPPKPGEVDEAAMLRQQLKEANQALRQYREQDVATERVLQALKAALSHVEAPGKVDGLPAAPRQRGAHHEAALLLSDFHGGERVSGAAVHGLNTYDWAIQEARIGELEHALRSHLVNAPAITKLHLLCLGDMTSGGIHKELSDTNEFNPIEQGVRMGHLLAELFLRIARTYPRVQIEVVGVVGNHGRLDKAPAAKEIHSNIDWIAYKLCEALLTPHHHRIRCNFPTSSAVLHQVAGRTMYLWHGDGIRSTMPGVPWGGVSRRTNEIAKTYMEQGIRIDHFACGHFHQPNDVQLGRILMNGSLKGIDEWVLKQFGGGAPPAQMLALFDAKRCRLTDVKYITPTTGLPERGAFMPVPEAA